MADNVIPNPSDGGWEQRWHPLLREWVVYSAHRQNRPWSGEQSLESSEEHPAYDPLCYLCPGNTRVSGIVNPDYEGVYVFDNDRPSISTEAPDQLIPPPGIYQNKPAYGISRVICYSQTHNLNMSLLGIAQMQAVVKEWQRQTNDLSKTPGIESVCIFENRGELCGMSNAHPHGQIYATNFVYKNTQSYIQAATEHQQKTGQSLFEDILNAELSDGRRVVSENETIVAFVPYFARFAYEVYLMPRRHVSHITQLTDAESLDLADILRDVLIRMDNLWAMPFPYLMMLQQAPVARAADPLFRFHIALYPPLRTPQLRKYVAAHEVGGGNFLADTMPEDKAAELRSASTIHYTLR